jgi:3-carboxy-cis,cis-muconate cycloisomerase
MAFSLFDHPHFRRLLPVGEIRALFAPEAELAAMLRFEAALAAAEAELGLVPAEAAAAIEAACARLSPPPDALAEGLGRDGVIVPALIGLLRAAVAEPHGSHVHVGATSQDVIDTGLVLRLKPALAVLRRDLDTVIETLEALAAAQGGIPIMGRTRMQRALPITFADRAASWRRPLEAEREALDRLAGDLLKLQFGGAVGTLDKLGEKGPLVRAALARRLDLGDPGHAWHAERAPIVDLGHWLAKVSGSLGKIGQDLALMAQNEVGEAVLPGGGRSSAMAHKRNPVPAELLVTLARFNAGQSGLLQQAMVHEGERSGAAWTLEWLVLPEMFAAAAAGLALAGACLKGLQIQPSEM